MLNIHKLDFDIIFAQCYNSFPLGEGLMDIAKQKIIYELIQKDLQTLSDRRSKLTRVVNANQRYAYLTTPINFLFRKQVHNYKQLLPIIANTVKMIGLSNNSISYSQVIENLIHDGYLSFNTSLLPYDCKDDVDFIDLTGFAGIDVIRKEGCCRHFVGLSHDIFYKLHLYNHMFFCHHWYSKEPFTPQIKEEFHFFTGNHVANLIQYNEAYYIHDSYNRDYFYFANSFTAEQYSKSDNISILFYSPVVNKLFSKNSYPQILEQMKHFEESSLKPHMDISETNDRFYNSTKLLHDFREEALPYMKKIAFPQNNR